MSKSIKKYIPDRGDIIWLDFDPQTGHEQKGRRPAVVLSPKIYNQKTNLAILCPITSKEKGYPFEVQIKGRQIQGVALSDQVKNLDWSIRNADFMERISKLNFDEITENIRMLIQE
jgi:mRNA interferase MazF